EAGDFLDGESSLLQAALDDAGNGKGGEGRAARAEPTDLREQRVVPHFWVFGRRETVAKPGVDMEAIGEFGRGAVVECGEGGAGVVEQQLQLNPVVIATPVKARHQWRVTRQHLFAQRSELRPLLLRARELLALQREALD